MQCLKTIVCSYFACCGEQRGQIKVSENYSREEGRESPLGNTHTQKFGGLEEGFAWSLKKGDWRRKRKNIAKGTMDPRVEFIFPK